MCAQAQVLTIVARACRHKSVAKELVKNHALLPWINGVILTRYANYIALYTLRTCILFAVFVPEL